MLFLVMEELKTLFLSVNQSVAECLICNKSIRANYASSLTDDEWKTLMNVKNMEQCGSTK